MTSLFIELEIDFCAQIEMQWFNSQLNPSMEKVAYDGNMQDLVADSLQSRPRFDTMADMTLVFAHPIVLNSVPYSECPPAFDL